MKLSFHGAAQTVTGSKHLLHFAGNKKILLDCGMFQGMGLQTTELNSNWGFEPQSIDYVILSHAHIDHSGLLPKLVKDGFDGKIFCTPATATLAKVLLVDSARIQEADAVYVNKRRRKEGKPIVQPLYTEEDVEKLFHLFETIPYKEHYRIEDGVELLYTDAGHIIGSAAVHLKIKENGKTTSISFSGDIGRYRDMILRSPDSFPQADVIIMESTYGDKLHAPASTSVDTLLKHIIHTCQEKKGRLIMPAFSLGRTQEILYMLNRLEIENRLPALNYYVDSPLSIRITEITKKYPDYFNSTVQKLLRNDEDVFAFKGLRYIEAVEESMALNESREPCVVISASGMAEAGRVKHHVAHAIENKRNTVLLTGYCESQSLGGRLKRHPQEVSIFGQRFQVQAEIEEISSLSAHGDFEDLSQWLACQNAGQVQQLFLVHGEYEVQQRFREKLLHKGFSEVLIPAQHQPFSIA